MPTQDESQSAENAVPFGGVKELFEILETPLLDELITATRNEVNRLESELVIAKATEQIIYEIVRSRGDWMPF